MRCDNCGGEDFTVQKTQRSRSIDGKISYDSDVRIYMCGRFGLGGAIVDGCGVRIRVLCQKIDIITTTVPSIAATHVDPSEVRR